jgi:hypothetical protein
MLDEAPGYDPAREPLSAWLDALVDGFARERAIATPPMFIAGQPPEHPALRSAA